MFFASSGLPGPHSHGKGVAWQSLQIGYRWRLRSASEKRSRTYIWEMHFQQRRRTSSWRGARMPMFVSRTLWETSGVATKPAMAQTQLADLMRKEISSDCFAKPMSGRTYTGRTSLSEIQKPSASPSIAFLSCFPILGFQTSSSSRMPFWRDCLSLALINTISGARSAKPGAVKETCTLLVCTEMECLCKAVSNNKRAISLQ